MYLTEYRKQRPRQGEGRFLYAIPYFVMFWADGEQASNNGMAVINSK
jgi:hypothetical protein